MEDFVFMCKVGRERVEGKIEANSKLRTHWQNQSVSDGISNAAQSKIHCYTFCSKTCKLFMFYIYDILQITFSLYL